LPWKKVPVRRTGAYRQKGPVYIKDIAYDEDPQERPETVQ